MIGHVIVLLSSIGNGRCTADLLVQFSASWSTRFIYCQVIAMSGYFFLLNLSQDVRSVVFFKTFFLRWSKNAPPCLNPYFFLHTKNQLPRDAKFLLWNTWYCFSSSVLCNFWLHTVVVVVGYSPHDYDQWVLCLSLPETSQHAYCGVLPLPLCSWTGSSAPGVANTEAMGSLSWLATAFLRGCTPNPWVNYTNSLSSLVSFSNLVFLLFLIVWSYPSLKSIYIILTFCSVSASF